jgi:hypothetical protein
MDHITADDYCEHCPVLLDSTLVCPNCGVYHGEFCPSCKARGWHLESCEDYVAGRLVIDTSKCCGALPCGCPDV